MLSHIAFSYNTSVHSSTGYSPFFLAHGREARMPIETMFGGVANSHSLPISYDDFVDGVTKRMKHASYLVGQELVKCQERQSNYFDSKSRFQPYSIGDLVWIDDPAKQSDKLAARWNGPFRVTRVMNNGTTYQLQNLSNLNKPAKILHYNRLKPFCSPYNLGESENGNVNIPMQVQIPRLNPQREIPEDRSEPQAPSSSVTRDNRVTRVGRKVKLPSYLNDYELDI